MTFDEASIAPIGCIAAAEALGDRPSRSGADALLLAGMQRAGAAHAAHHLVEDQQHAMAVADLADALEIARRRAATTPSVAPTTVSATKAMTVSAPSRQDLGVQFVGERARP